jgi:hypothetical protein
MKTVHQFTLSAVAAALLLGLGGRAGISSPAKNTAIGAGAAGGVIGHEAGK